MPAPLSPDLRRRVFAASKTMSAPKTAARFNVSVSTVHRLRRLDRTTGALEPRPHGGGHPLLITSDDREHIDECLAEDPSMTHEAIAERFRADTERVVSPSTVGRALLRWGVTRKKSP